MADLLTSAGLRRLAEDIERTAGVDMVPEVEPLGALVMCPEMYEVPEGWTCPHTCKPGSCEGCPAKDAHG